MIAREREEVVAALMDNRRQLLQTTADGPVPALAPLDLDRWVLWRPSKVEAMSEVRVGALRDGAEGEALGVPCVVPLVPGRALVIVNQTERQRALARDLWLAVITRIAALTAGQFELILIDPTRSIADPRLFNRVVGGVDVPAELDRLATADAPPRGRFVAVADVPSGLGPREAALLLAMVREGAAGSTVVMHLDLEQYRAAIGEPDLGTDAYRWLIDVGVTDVAEAGPDATVLWDGAPSAALVDLIVERVTTG